MKLLSKLKDTSHPGHGINAATLLSLDPIAQFACVLAALLQDLSHLGVPNFVLIQEKTDSAEKYRNRCITEQQSIDTAWDLLMQKKYEGLQYAIFRTAAEKRHFRQVFVQCMLATDVSDKELTIDRGARWEMAFSAVGPEMTPQIRLEMQATLLLEHIVECADMVHTMMDWDDFRKWSGLLFVEVFRAHQQGKIGNPSKSWYKGELFLFDSIAVPLVEKLARTNSFVDGTILEYANLAIMNRNKWEETGTYFIETLVRMLSQMPSS